MVTKTIDVQATSLSLEELLILLEHYRELILVKDGMPVAKVSSLLTEDYLEERAKRGSRAEFEAILAKVPDVEPEERDRL